MFETTVNTMTKMRLFTEVRVNRLGEMRRKASGMIDKAPMNHPANPQTSSIRTQ